MVVTFDPSSSGQLALVLYEWDDVKYLGADTPGNEDDSMPVRKRFCGLVETKVYSPLIPVSF